MTIKFDAVIFERLEGERAANQGEHDFVAAELAHEKSQVHPVHRSYHLRMLSVDREAVEDPTTWLEASDETLSRAHLRRSEVEVLVESLARIDRLSTRRAVIQAELGPRNELVNRCRDWIAAHTPGRITP